MHMCMCVCVCMHLHVYICDNCMYLYVTLKLLCNADTNKSVFIIVNIIIFHQNQAMQYQHLNNCLPMV